MPTDLRQRQLHRVLGVLGISTDHPDQRARQPGESAAAYRARLGRAAPPAPDRQPTAAGHRSGLTLLTEEAPRVVGRTLVEMPDDTPPEAKAIIVAPPGEGGEAAGRVAAAARIRHLPTWHHRHHVPGAGPDDGGDPGGAVPAHGEARHGARRAHARHRRRWGPEWLPKVPALPPLASRQGRVAGAAVAAVVLVAILVPVLTSGSSSTTRLAVRAATKTAHPPAEKPAIGADGVPIAVPLEPGGGITLFPSHRLVAFYGTPGVPNLGVLGDAPASALWPRLAAAAAPFASPGVTVVPSYELITYTAEAAPGPNGTYTQEQPASVIENYLQVVHQHHGMLILDIQPGLSSMLADAQALEPYLLDPDVGLALDPEWELKPGERPDEQVGTTDAAEINQVSTWLSQLVAVHHLPQKLLMIHQFQARQIPDKGAITPQRNLAMMFNMDGFGTPQDKASVYSLLASDPRFPLGYKLFYTRDTPVLTPAQALALSPTPVAVEYE